MAVNRVKEGDWGYGEEHKGKLVFSFFFSGSARAYARACHGDSKPSPLPSLTLNNIQIFLNKKGEVRV